MATRDLTTADFSTTIDTHDIVIVDFWAEWCGPCRAFAPVFKAASEAHPDVVFAKVDTENNPEIAQHFQIRAIPTLMVFREKVLLFNQAGALRPADLESLITQVKALDMAGVHAEIAEQEARAVVAES